MAALGRIQALGVAARHGLCSKEQPLQLRLLTVRVLKFSPELVDFAAEVHDLTAGRCEIALRIGRRRDLRQTLLKENRQPVALTRNGSAAPGAPCRHSPAFRSPKGRPSTVGGTLAENIPPIDVRLR